MVRLKKSQTESQPFERISADPIFFQNIPGIKRVYPLQAVRPAMERARLTQNSLEGLFKIELYDPSDFNRVFHILRQQEQLVYVEPYYTYQPLYIPSDPEGRPGGKQNYLEKTGMYQAWDIQKGDTSIVIGIVDTGTDLDHTDLKNNLYYHYADPVNGLDDDLDGYVDNFIGWDFADNDNLVEADRDDHGTRLSGISSAETDNSTGLAGVGFKTRYLPIKIFRSSDNEFNNGFEALLYAAEMGCSVLVLSWGSAETYSQYAQDIINYLVEDLDVVVVAAAGNTNEEINFYPATYANVLSVGSVDSLDKKSPWATYNHFIDLVAQGSSVYTTLNGGLYGYSDGSSFAVPQVAAVAALLRALHPDWSARQVAEQLRVTTDPIDQVNGNQAYLEKLGKGRLNALRALSDSMAISCRMTDLEYNNGLGPFIYQEDTVSVMVTLQNFLNDLHNGSVILSTSSPYVHIVDSVFSIGHLVSSGAKNNHTQPFTFVTTGSLPYDQPLTFRLGFSADQYTDFQYFVLKSSPPYMDLQSGNIKISVSDNGNLGYYKDSLMSGIGLNYRNEKVSDQSGIMFTSDGRMVADNVVMDPVNQVRSKDFTPVSAIRPYRNSESDIDVRSNFQELDSLNNNNGLMMGQRVMGWNRPEAGDLLIIEYNLANPTSDTLKNLRFGLYNNWDLGQKNKNRASWMPSDSIGYVETPGGNTLTGISLLTGQQFLYVALDLDSAGSIPPDIPRLFTDSVKASLLYGNLNKTAAGISGEGNDVANLLVAEIGEIKPGENVKMAYAIIFASDTARLAQNRSLARELYDEYWLFPPINRTQKVCYNGEVVVEPENGTLFRFYSDPHLDHFIKEDSLLLLSGVTQDTVLYVVNADSLYAGLPESLPVIIDEPSAGYSFLPDPSVIYNEIPAEVRFISTGSGEISWNWDFGNGYGSTLKESTAWYDEPGEYTIRLMVTNSTKCIDSLTGTLEVLSAKTPEIRDTTVCRETRFLLDPEEVGVFRLYSDLQKQNLLFEGTSILFDPFREDTLFYIASWDGEVESMPDSFRIYLSLPDTGFNWEPDTLNTNQKDLLRLDYSGDGEWEWRINGNYYSRQRDTLVNYAGIDSLLIQLVVRDDKGCLAGSEELIRPKVSEVPQIEDIYLCSPDRVTLHPGGGRYFLFYEDTVSRTILKKGSSFTLDHVENNITIFVSSVDSLLESDLKPVFITLVHLKAGFIMEPDTLNLSEDNLVKFFDRSDGSTGWKWEFEKNGWDTLKITGRNYYDVGSYEVKLTVSDSFGCQDDTLRILQVVNITGWSGSLIPPVFVYPNPSRGLFYFGNLHDLHKSFLAEIWASSGRLLASKKISREENFIDLTGHPPGIYYVIMFHPEGWKVQKILIQ